MRTGSAAGTLRMFERRITLARISELVNNLKEEFIHENILPLSEEELEKIRKLQSDWGVETAEEEIDDMYEGRILIGPEVRHGKPIIKNTRVPVAIIVGSLAGGMSIEEVAEEYGIERDDVFAAIEYATRIVTSEEITVLYA